MKNILKSSAFIGAGVLLTVAGTTMAMIAPTSLFRDVPQDAYYTDSVEAMNRKGIITGYEDGRFGPDDFVTRGQVAVMLRRYDKNVVQPLRDQIAELYKELGLQPPTEPEVVLCEGKYQPGESYTAADGCNTCRCGENGVAACTKMYCAPEKKRCSSSEQCPANMECSTVYGDCDSNCEDGQPCTDVCVGVCEVKRPENTLSCGEAKSSLAEALVKEYSCNTDADCTTFMLSCPFVTCGTAVHVSAVERMKNLADQRFATCDDPVSCASCVYPGEPVCRNNVCVLE